MCLYGDPAYPLRAHLQGPFRGAALTQDQKNYNTAMNGARIAVEWGFGEIINYFKLNWFKCSGENVHRLCLDSERSYYFVPVY